MSSPLAQLLDHLTAKHHAAEADTRRLRGELRRNRPATLDLDASAHLADLEGGSEALARHHRRAPTERAAMLGEIVGELTAVRRRAAQGALFKAVRSVTEVTTEVRAFTAQCRADVLRSMPMALHYVDANGMITLELYRVQLTSALSQAPAAVLRATYERALDRKAAPDVVALEVIEQLADTRQPLAVTIEDRPAAQQLRELVEAAPGSARARRGARCRGPGRRPGPPPSSAPPPSRFDPLRPAIKHPDVRAALDAEAEAMEQAGEADDATDQAALREQLAAGGGRTAMTGRRPARRRTPRATGTGGVPSWCRHNGSGGPGS